MWPFGKLRRGARSQRGLGGDPMSRRGAGVLHRGHPGAVSEDATLPGKKL